MDERRCLRERHSERDADLGRVLRAHGGWHRPADPQPPGLVSCCFFLGAESPLAARTNPSPAFLTQYPPKSALVLLSKDLKRTIGSSGCSTGKAEEVGAGGHTGVPRSQVTIQEMQTCRHLTGSCREKLQAGEKERAKGSPKGLGKGTPVRTKERPW